MSEDDANIRERRFPVEKNHDGFRMDQFLSAMMPRLTRSRAGEIAKHGDVSIIPERRVKAGTKLRKGDIVVVREHLDPEVVDDSRVEIAYEDSEIVVVNKPPGMLVHESTRVRLNTVQAFLVRAGFLEADPAHRLDRETSGVLLCGKNKEATRRLNKMFAEAHPTKTYRAIVEDSEQVWSVGDKRTIETPLGLDPDSIVRVRMTHGSLRAVTHVECLWRNNEIADLRVDIETGRQHQIRIHLAMQNTPIAGDKLYLYDDEFFCAITDDRENEELNARLRFPTHALHAWRIGFEHPFTGSQVAVEAGLPSYWDYETS